MPRGQTKRRRSGSDDNEDYASDDGFVADAPKSKKPKPSSSSSTRAKPQASSKTGGSGPLVDDQNHTYFELSAMRRVTLSEFKGKTLINIREYYEKDGEMAPGAKGIALTTDQFSTLVTLLPQIEMALERSGVAVPRPKYDDSGEAGEQDEDGEEGEEAGAEDKDGENRHEKKRNIDTTSEEGED